MCWAHSLRMGREFISSWHGEVQERSAGRHLATALEDEDACFGFVWGFSCRAGEAHNKNRNKTTIQSVSPSVAQPVRVDSLPYDPSPAPPLGASPKKMKTLTRKDACAPRPVQSRRMWVSISRCMGRKYSAYTQWSTALKKNETPYAATWMDLEGITGSEISQRKTNMISHMCGI